MFIESHKKGAKITEVWIGNINYHYFAFGFLTDRYILFCCCFCYAFFPWFIPEAVFDTMNNFTEALRASTLNRSDAGEAELSRRRCCQPPSDSELLDYLRWNNAALGRLSKLQQPLEGAKQKPLIDGKSGCRHRRSSSASPCDGRGRRLRVFGGTEMDRGERHYKHLKLGTTALLLSILTVSV